MSTNPTYAVGDRIRTAVHVPGDEAGPDIPVGSPGMVVDIYPDPFGFGPRVAVRLDCDGPGGLPVFYYAAEIEIAPEGPAAPVEGCSAPRRFELVRDVDVTGVTGTGTVADGVMWPDGTASVRWRGDHPSIVFWDRGWESVACIHGHGGHTRVVWGDPDPAGLDAEEADQ